MKLSVYVNEIANIENHVNSAIDIIEKNDFCSADDIKGTLSDLDFWLKGYISALYDIADKNSEGEDLEV